MLDIQAISHKFREEVERAREQQRLFHPAFAVLQEILSDLAKAGVQELSCVYADLSQMVKHNLTKGDQREETEKVEITDADGKTQKKEVDKNFTYALMRVQDGVYLLRIDDKMTLDMNIQNINTVRDPIALKNPDFWYLGRDKDKPKFIRCKLDEEEGRNDLTEAILDAAAARVAARELARHNYPSENGTLRVAKPAGNQDGGAMPLIR